MLALLINAASAQLFLYVLDKEAVFLLQNTKIRQSR